MQFVSTEFIRGHQFLVMRVVAEVLHAVPKSCEDWRMNKSVNPWPNATCSAMDTLVKKFPL